VTKQSTTLPVLDAACCAPLVTEPLTGEQATTLAAMFKALGDPVRLRLLSLIASHGGEVCVCDLTPRFSVTGPTISHHLRVLREAGLIDCERRGTWVYYWLRPGVLDQLASVLDVDRLRAAGEPTAGARA
jgi:ArsR family transcriptional regulator, arsenate/arsenite/antimonite-responsive transcriptional repressor